MDYSNKTKPELVALCKERGIKGYSTQKKEGLVALLLAVAPTPSADVITQVVPPAAAAPVVHRLNYIGSKFQLLEWMTGIMREKTGWDGFNGKRVSDIFAGTGIVSHHFRLGGSPVLSNDAELYSSIITHAFTRSVYSANCEAMIQVLKDDVVANKHAACAGFITKNYSPHNGCERKFFTVENARRIDYIRGRIEELKPTMDCDEYKFMVASLLLSADAVSNVPAVYGCFLHNYKSKALKTLMLDPIHDNRVAAAAGSTTFHSDVLDDAFLGGIHADMVYLDPPYNGRQYSKNYFPLNMIAMTPSAVASTELHGKTGIPNTCFMSPFCKKGKVVEDAFEKLFRDLDTTWIFLSYNSESTVPKDTMLALMRKYGEASVVERDYKRFKSFEYNQDVEIKEYLFCLQKTRA